MKTVIVYHSSHHNNTKKLLEAIAEQGDVTLLQASHAKDVDLSAYDLIGFASGIYYQQFHKSVLRCAQKNLPSKKPVFFLYTCGLDRSSYTNALRKIADSRNSPVIGTFGCLGFDTFGPFKLVGGIAKGRPNEEDVAKAVRFFSSLNSL